MATITQRQTADDGVRYRVRIRIRGEKPLSKTFRRKTDAVLWANKVESDLGHGVYVPTTADRRRTVADLVDKYIAERLPNAYGSQQQRDKIKAQLGWWKEHAGYLTLDRLTPAAIAQCRGEVAARMTGRRGVVRPSTVNRYLTALSAVCKWAWRELGWLQANPVLAVTKGPEHTGIVRYLDNDERKALLDACRASRDPNIYTAITLALCTGARAGNIRNLTWDDVDLKGWRLRFRHVKNGEPRYVPLVGMAQSVLQAHFDRDPTGKGWVFKGGRDDAPADFDRPWRAVRKAAGLVGERHARFHDLRHSCASYLTMNGASLSEVAEALGHRTLVMAQRYSHQSGEHVRATLETDPPSDGVYSVTESSTIHRRPEAAVQPRQQNLLIPFNRPYMTGKELWYISQAHANGHLAGDGPFGKKCQSWLEKRTGCHQALLTHSCTAALEMAAFLADIRPGDEVILPSYTFVSTANAFVLRGAEPVFVDIRPDTLNIDERKIEAAITPKTKAIVAVHYAGVACEMDTIMAIAREHRLLVIEDAAQALMAQYRGRPLGSIGHLAALSFHETKNITSGEGGALLVNCPRFAERAEIIREKGTNRSQFFRGQVDKYTWVDVGSSFLPSELAAAFLWAQMEQADEITQRRRGLWQTYHEAFAILEEQGRIRRPIVPMECTHNAHMYYLLLPDLEVRTAFIARLAERGIDAVFHYVPLHSSPMGQRCGRPSGTLAQTCAAGERLVRLPLWLGLEADLPHVIESVADALH